MINDLVVIRGQTQSWQIKDIMEANGCRRKGKNLVWKVGVQPRVVTRDGNTENNQISGHEEERWFWSVIYRSLRKNDSLTKTAKVHTLGAFIRVQDEFQTTIQFSF
jgi:hypothetical protein